MKVHTSHKDVVEKILNDIKLDNQKGLTFRLIEDYFKFNPLTNEHYTNLPEFKWSDTTTDRYIFDVELNNEEESKIFFESFNHKPTKNSYIHYMLNKNEEFEYDYTHKVEPKYPIYVITKGRWEKTLTIDTLEEMGVDFKICVEPSEYENYISNPSIDKNKIIVLPENFSERKQGGIPVRNFVWEHSKNSGHSKHWIVDDNILGFYRWNNNQQKKVKDGVFFRIMEDFSDRYENLGLVSCQYTSFVPTIDVSREQFILNTRTYSCILINTELLDKRLDERWRGTYNEDTDLTLRVLTTGDLCTVNFNSLLSGKQTTGSMTGGNTSTIYENGSVTGYQKKFDELKNNWPDIVKFTTGRHKDGRPHHHISYTKLFKQNLILKEGVSLEPKVNNYNMVIKKPNTIKLKNIYSNHEQFYKDLILEVNETNENMFGEIYKIKYDDTNGNKLHVTNKELNLFVVNLPLIYEGEDEISVEYNVNKII